MALKITVWVDDEEIGFSQKVRECPDLDLAVEKAGAIIRYYEKVKELHDGQPQE